jgi:hypothetical protein
MDSIVEPPRITSLGPQPLRILLHTAPDAIETLDFPAVFPSETVAQIKQRIAARKDGAPFWMPAYQFLAKSAGDAYTPVDVRWPFSTVPDPFHLKGPDPRLFADGERKIGNPILLPARLLTDAFEESEPRVLHVWSLRSIREAMGSSESGELFIGYYQLYFPNLLTPADVERGCSTAVVGDARTVLLEHVAANEEKLALLETLLHEAPATPASLHDLRQISFTLPSKSGGSLEMLFYNTAPSPVIPFLRYFPSQVRVAPLVKYSETILSDRRLFEALMYDQPAAGEAVLLMKVPLGLKSPFGVAWTLRITYKEGSLHGEVSMGAPRRDMPLKVDTVRRAFEQLWPFLDATPFPSRSAELSNLTAVYAITSPLSEKPSKREWGARLGAFTPLFHNDVLLRGDKADFALRYKAISNYKEETDPKRIYLTTLFLRDATASEGSIPVASYIASLVSEFGIGAQEATSFVSQWVLNEAKAIVDIKEGSEAERERFVKLHPMGISVSLYNNHPHYLVAIAGCDSAANLQRILSLMAMLVVLPTDRFALSGSATAAASGSAATASATGYASAPVTGSAAVATAESAPDIASAEPVVAVPPEGRANLWNMLNLGEGGDVYEGDGAEGTAQGTTEGTAQGTTEGTALAGEAVAAVAGVAGEPTEAVAAEPAAEKEAVAMPLRLSEGEVIKPLIDPWYILQYKARDDELFDLSKHSEGAVVAPYSSHCQANGHQQPNILTPEEYARARSFYGDTVFWLETPPPPRLQAALKCADESPANRLKLFAPARPEGSRSEVNKEDIARIVELEILALTHGFPLHSDESIASLKKVAKFVPEEQVHHIQELIKAQRRKELWVVARAGTNLDHPNYFLCVEHWCVRDKLPLLKSEFHGTVWRNPRDKSAKPADTCAFCGGSAIEKRKGGQVLPGETVLVRKPRSTGKVAKYAGFFEDINYHPLHFALPCCFTTLKRVLPPPGSVYPPLHEEEEAASAPAVVVDDENRRRPFSPKTSKSGIKQNSWYIPTQTIVGRNRERSWIDVERGGVAVPPAAVNQLLGQDPEVFLTKKRGVGDMINTHLAINTTAFVRYGLEHSPRNPGVQFTSLLCYADYACRFLTDPTAVIDTPADRLNFLLGDLDAETETEHTIAMIRGLEQAGYGTLLHEMSKPGEVPPDGKLSAWCRDLGIAFDSTTNKAESRVLWLAWQNFKHYLRNNTIAKELRLWDALFACPGLLTPTGVILVVIRVPKQKGEKATFQCPSMGVAFAQQRAPPPFLFLMMDEETGQYDPLVLYESRREVKARGGAGAADDESTVVYELLGALQNTVALSRLAPRTRDVLMAFFAEYTDSRTGCGRSAPPVHPWMPVATKGALPIPVSSDLAGLTSTAGLVPKVLLRDRSNRLVGVLLQHGPHRVYVPLLDDGILHVGLPSLRGEEGLPHTDVAALFEVYGTLLGDRYPALKPVLFIPNEDDSRFIALRLACGVTVPCDPFPRTRSVDHPLFAEVKARPFVSGPRELPWRMDAELLRPEVRDHPDLLAPTSEEVLSESYELLRLSFSHLLAEPEHRVLSTHIDRLRQARRLLPLWEIQKRMEYLLMPVVHALVTTEGSPVSAHKDILRRDCRLTERSKCGGGCVWIAKHAANEGTCLIHTRVTGRYKDPLRLLTARLVDELVSTFDLAHELLENRVSAIKPLEPGAILRSGDSVLFSAAGRSTSELLSRLGYDQRKSTRFTQGLTYPEEVGTEPELLADYALLRPVVPSAGVARDPRSAMLAVLSGYLGLTKQAVELETGRPWTASREDWQFVADRANVVVILHTVDDATHTILVDLPILRPAAGAAPPSAAKGTKFLLVNHDGLLFRNIETGHYEIPLSELPPSVRMQLA